VLNEFTVVTGTAGKGPLRVRWGRLGDPALAATLGEAGIRGPSDLAAMLLLGPREVAALASEAPPHIDDLPEVEYRSGRLLDREASWLGNFLELYAARARTNPFAAFPGDWGAVSRARDQVLRAQLRLLKARIAAR
jgi:hypothetical protein